MNDDSIDAVERFRAGDEHAAGELYEKYVHRLIALARGKMSPRLRRRVDPEDVVHSVYRSFFVKAGNDAFTFERSGDLWRLLSTITVNKVLRQVQRNRRKKRSMDREQSMQAGKDHDVLPPEVVASDPSPSEALVMIEEVEALMETLKPAHREMLALRLQGASTEEIALECDCSDRTVRRVLEKVRDYLHERQTSEDEEE
ncbi:RNA polymerase sigma factor [Lignipirellula cremea]|uniref:RNA polymerase sigma factor n=1 Tax=Lignipirellula cremea TaxID=2528010 RepID=A0A518DPA7_9BACT|nr:sigma-70 family RNA polymerase sigma factor [Lignipirellula cremea]QDU93677.1 RNA polymerase sigma factor [Lignipirellula cremea]